VNWFDAVALALLALFAWRGYRRGILGWVAGIGASLLALALAVALAPKVAPLIVADAGWSRTLSERVAFVALLAVLRLAAGLAARELVTSLRPFLRAIPLLGLVDHLLGVVPSVAIGAVLVALLLLAALALPLDRRLHDGAAASYVGRTAIAEAGRLTQQLPRGGLVSTPARLASAARLLR